ncbi:MAG: hypothetical protein AAGB22_04450, partial [Bacteroidota bacterium]
DVIITINYTAKDAGATFKTQQVVPHLNDNINYVMDELAGTAAGLNRMISLKREFPTELHQFLHPADGADRHETVLSLNANHFPHIFKDETLQCSKATIILKLRDGFGPVSGMAANAFELDNVGTPPVFGNSNVSPQDANNQLGGLATIVLEHTGTPDPRTDWTLTALETNLSSGFGPAGLKVGTNRLNPEAIEDILILFNYSK